MRRLYLSEKPNTHAFIIKNLLASEGKYLTADLKYLHAIFADHSIVEDIPKKAGNTK